MQMPPDDGTVQRNRVRVFIDFWNFQLSVNRLDRDFQIDWRRVGEVIANEASLIADPSNTLAYQGTNVYGSFDPRGGRDANLRRWASNTLSRFPGMNVSMIPRQRRRSAPRCPSCYEHVSQCPNCGADMRGTEEKGVDTRIVTDMIGLAWADNYDVAVLVSSDRDFGPVVEFLENRGIKTIHGAFPPLGSELTQTCWGNIPLPSLMDRFRRNQADSST